MKIPQRLLRLMPCLWGDCPNPRARSLRNDFLGSAGWICTSQSVEVLSSIRRNATILSFQQSPYAYSPVRSKTRLVVRIDALPEHIYDPQLPCGLQMDVDNKFADIVTGMWVFVEATQQRVCHRTSCSWEILTRPNQRGQQSVVRNVTTELPSTSRSTGQRSHILGDFPPVFRPH
ncbi:uncharacterized protein BDR25DRAFT_362524 [Lindgomyces ingoldianus]|uniref:Uncharacterized protein n=1 Tax=Lindgomyces ingoldianus TaxID=673940 RepID=A0ACB6QBH2_9PLEO|nr:uncharacterized protein BDR25DRAFT_362524 [Lindgomyces ingoldianus]KAF2463722.1 hypothetical protein BDR25DRAFT_362524 [Lindgomyces ingoldianus]